MITAIIRNKENTLVLELPHSIYDIYEKLQSIGIMQPPKQIPLTDNEDEDIGVKLFSESDFGQHLLLTLNEKNTIADANNRTDHIGQGEHQKPLSSLACCSILPSFHEARGTTQQL